MENYSIKTAHFASPIISVVIPVYNVEKYLLSCVESVLNQVCIDDCEIILVDDGSTDSSLEICKKIESSNQCVSVISKVNEGPAIARLTGARLAKGDYVLNLDGDDLLKQNTIKEIINILKQHCPDAVFFNLLSFGSGSNKEKKNLLSEGVYESERLETIKNGYLFSNNLPGLNYGIVLPSAGGKVIKRDIYINCLEKVPNSIFQAEDLIHNFYVISKCKSIYIWNSFSYLYRIRDDSTSNNISIKHLRNAMHVYDHLINSFPEYKTQICVYSINMIWNTVAHLVRNGANKDAVFDLLSTNEFHSLRVNSKKLRKNNFLLKDRIKLFLLFHPSWCLFKIIYK